MSTNKFTPETISCSVMLFYTCYNSGIQTSLGDDMLKNFRPVVNRSFFSKLIENIITARLLEHMTSCDVTDPMQSTYRKRLNTEIALLCVHEDVASDADRGHGVSHLVGLVRVLNMVDHTILLTFLPEQISLGGHALDWTSSYLRGRTQCVPLTLSWVSWVSLLLVFPEALCLGPLNFAHIYSSSLCHY